MTDKKWEIKNGLLSKNFQFADFSQAIKFINQVAQAANRQDHHPDIYLHDYSQVEIRLVSHDQGQITDQDHRLAEEIDKLA